MSINNNYQSHLYFNPEIINKETSNFNSIRQNVTEINNENSKNRNQPILEINPIAISQISKTKNPIKFQNIQISQNNNNFNNNYIEINEYLGKEANRPLTMDILDMKVKNFESGKISSKNMGIIKAYGANTHEGLIRNYNEDRVSIIINMNKPKNYNSELKGKWPKVSFFAIYDGHGGKNCAEYLRDNLHKFICNDINFPNNIPEAIKNGFYQAENDFLNNIALSKLNNNVNDRSGSCAVVILLVNNKVYIANVGDSRAIMSTNNGKNLKEITIDHKPNEIKEKNRIIKNGGKVYQSQTPLNNNNNNNTINQILIGPYRVFPGRLSVSRTIGDIEAKNIKFGGNPNVIIAEPEIYIFDLINDNIDFFILGCDGIFDQMNNYDIFNSVWMVINYFCKNGANVHNICGKIVDYVLKGAMARKSFDNVTCLIVTFKDLGDQKLFGKDFGKGDNINNLDHNNNSNNEEILNYDNNGNFNGKNTGENNINFNKKMENKDEKKTNNTINDNINHNSNNYVQYNINQSINNNLNNNIHNINNNSNLNNNNKLNNNNQIMTNNNKNHNINNNSKNSNDNMQNSFLNNINENKNENHHTQTKNSNNDKVIKLQNSPKNLIIKPYYLNPENNFQQSRFTQRETNTIFQLSKNSNLKSSKIPINNISNDTNNNNYINNSINVNIEKYSPKIMNRRYSSTAKSKIGFSHSNLFENKLNNSNNKYSIMTERISHQYSTPKYNNQKNNYYTEPNNYNSFIFMSKKNPKIKKNYNNNNNGFKKRKELTLDIYDNYNFYLKNNVPNKFNSINSNFKDNGFLSYTVGKSYQFKNEKNDLWK